MVDDLVDDLVDDQTHHVLVDDYDEAAVVLDVDHQGRPPSPWCGRGRRKMPRRGGTRRSSLVGVGGGVGVWIQGSRRCLVVPSPAPGVAVSRRSIASPRLCSRWTSHHHKEAPGGTARTGTKMVEWWRGRREKGGQ